MPGHVDELDTEYDSFLNKLSRSRKIGNKEEEEKIKKKYSVKIKKCYKILAILRECITELDGFIFNLTNKPQDILKTEDKISKTLKQVPKFSSNELNEF